MDYIILPLTVRAGAIRNIKSPVNCEKVQRALALFDGVTVQAQVYSGTNKCFHITKDMCKKAWKKLDKQAWWWVTEDHVDDIIERYTAVNEYGHTLAITLPNICCVETPEEIEAMIVEHKDKGRRRPCSLDSCGNMYVGSAVKALYRKNEVCSFSCYMIKKHHPMFKKKKQH